MKSIKYYLSFFNVFLSIDHYNSKIILGKSFWKNITKMVSTFNWYWNQWSVDI